MGACMYLSNPGGSQETLGKRLYNGHVASGSAESQSNCFQGSEGILSIS